MTARNPDSYGVITGPDTVRFERLLPGPIERVWACLTDSEKRGQWLASGEMEPRVGGAVVLRFENARLSPVGTPVPEKFKKYDRVVTSPQRVTRFEPPRFLGLTWGDEKNP